MLAVLKSFKTYAYIAVLLALISSGWTAYNKIYDAGYNAARVEIQEDSIAAANRAVAKARQEWEASVAAGETALIVEERITRNIRDVEKRIKAAVESVDSSCRDLGASVLGLLNDAVDSANSRREKSVTSP